jgi:beta-lactamase superfamily II metal-dependent hydrolase
MALEFFLFDIGQGQAAATKLPNGRWCVFDIGANRDFSPIHWVVERERASFQRSIGSYFGQFTFSLLKATISHLHGDHLGDYEGLKTYCPDHLRTVAFDKEYVDDALDSSAPGSKAVVADFCLWTLSSFGESSKGPDYGDVSIKEMALPVLTTRLIGGGSTNRVNNASVITRIEYCGVSILLCGDIERDAWELALNSRHLGSQWRPFVENVDVLVAPHHGHSSGYSSSLLSCANPQLVLASVASRDPSVDSRYSQVPGVRVAGETCKCLTTRSAGGHIRITIKEPLLPLGDGSWRCDVNV